MSEADWREILARFAPYAALLAKKPSYDRPPDTARQADFPGLPPLVPAGEDDALKRAFLPVAPEEALDKISSEELDELLAEDTQKGIRGICAAGSGRAPHGGCARSRKVDAFSRAFVYAAHELRFLRGFL